VMPRRPAASAVLSHSISAAMETTVARGCDKNADTPEGNREESRTIGTRR